PEAEHLVHQAHGLVEVVSRDAVLDRQPVAGVDHRSSGRACSSRCPTDPSPRAFTTASNSSGSAGYSARLPSGSSMSSVETGGTTLRARSRYSRSLGPKMPASSIRATEPYLLSRSAAFLGP